ncbi:MAG: type II toxin-antitoxin system PemK/MazF family toxin [Candidatus Kapaibacterium sp.]
MNKKFIAGEIVYANLGKPPKEVVGHEQGKERPCIIVNTFPSLQLAVIVPLTSKTPPRMHYTHVFIPSGTAKLTNDSYVLCHQLRTISYDRISRNLEVLDTSSFFKILSVLKAVLRLP